MDIKALEYFLVCVERGSLTAAAEELYTSQPHVSQVIRSLEAELETKLFRRTGSGITLTEEGEKIRIYAENVIKNISLIKESCEEKDTLSLQIAANSSSSLAYLIGEYISEQKDNIRLEYRECGIEEMLYLIQYRGYEVGFLFMPENKMAAFNYMIHNRHLEYIPILYNDLYVHSGKGSKFYDRERIEPEELDGCNVLLMENDFFASDELLFENENFRKGKCKIKRAIRTNSGHFVREMLKYPDYCNIGTYWYGGKKDMEHAHRTVVKGFEKKVSFGYLKADSVTLSPQIEELIGRIKDMIHEM